MISIPLENPAVGIFMAYSGIVFNAGNFLFVSMLFKKEINWSLFLLL